jgi:hypothetical protein
LNIELRDQLSNLTADNKQQVLQLWKQVPSAQTAKGHRAVKGGIPPDGYMSTRAYGKLRKDTGLMDTDQDVFHIIASLRHHTAAQTMSTTSSTPSVLP